MPLPFRITPIRREEVFRRAAMSNPSEAEMALYEACCRDGGYTIDYHIIERNRPLSLLGEDPLRQRLAGCDAIIIFTASLGDAFRELVEEQEEPESRILYQGLAAERMDALTESYLDYKEKHLPGAVLTPHFPYHWEGAEENAFTTTRIVGVSFHPENIEISRCRSCFAENCPSRREAAAESLAETEAP